jgi:TPR repeat protein
VAFLFFNRYFAREWKAFLVFAQLQLTVGSVEQNRLQENFAKSQLLPTETVASLAQRGDADAQFSLGIQFSNGEGDARDYLQAAGWYLKAAEQNHAMAQFNLGIMYAQGQGVERNTRISIMWISMAADQGDAGAQHNLGLTLHQASIDGAPENAGESRIEACKWFQLAAAQGYNRAGQEYSISKANMSGEDALDCERRVSAFVPTKGYAVI